MSRKRTIYAAVTALAALGFIVDRFLLPPPASAEAEVVAGSVRPPKAKKPAGKIPGEIREPADPSVHILDRIPELRDVRDVFQPSEQMLKHYRRLQEDQEKDESKAPKPGSREAFETEYHLQATFTSSGKMMAMVNGKLLRPGDSLGGFQLVRVGPKSAEFSRGQDRVVLAIPGFEGG